ncbi:MAG TPA: 3-oxoacid CoA-transferase subunit A [Xanthobacteraceae bacterium]|jgi:acetate CoA/acetoacetate CoA-transferase alpha subunit
MKKSISLIDAVKMIPANASLMIGGFMGIGSPHRIIAELVRQKRSGLTIIANDTARPDFGIGLLINAKLAARVIASHIGTNPETQRQMIAKEMDVELCPQGTLAERIRAAGYGLGAVVTATGLGTVVADGKQTIEVNGKKFLIELPLKADFALISARRSDYQGNLEYALTARNFNPVMAMAADTVIAEADEIVPVGVIPPDAVMTPHVVVDYVIERNSARGQ